MLNLTRCRPAAKLIFHPVCAIAVSTWKSQSRELAVQGKAKKAVTSFQMTFNGTSKVLARDGNGQFVFYRVISPSTQCKHLHRVVSQIHHTRA